MQRTIKKGHAADAGLIRHIFVQDSTSTTGAGKTGLIFSDFTVRYIRNGGTLSGAITAQDIAVLGTYAAPTLNTNIRIKEVDATNAPGLYEVQLHLDWVATGADVLSIRFAATGAANTWLAMPLDAFDPQDTMRLGLTALPNAAAAAAGGLPVSNAGGLDLDAKLAATNEVTAARMAALTDWTNGGRLDLILDSILAMLDDARAEPVQGAPPVNPDAMTKIDYLYKAWRNKHTTDAGSYKLYNDDTVTVGQKATLSDDGTTFAKSEVGTGP